MRRRLVAEPVARRNAIGPALRADAAAHSLRSLARGGALNLVSSVISALAGIVLVLLVARGFSLTEAGMFFAATSVFLIAVRVAELGTQTGLVYFIARCRALAEQHRVTRYLRAAALPVLGVALAMAVVMFLAAPWLSDLIIAGDPGELAVYLRILAVFLPLAVIADVCLSATRGYGTMRPTALIDRVGRPLAQTALVVGAVALGSTVALTLAWAVPYLAAAIGAAWWLARQRGRPADRADSPRSAGEAGALWRFSLPRWVASLAQITLQRLDIVLVAALRGPEEAAIYTAATRFLVVGQLAGQAIAQAVQPQLGVRLALDDQEGTRTLYQTATAWLVLIVWPFYLVFAVLAPFVLQLFGARYVEGAVVVMVLTVAMIVATGCGMVDTVLNMAGRTTWNLGNAVLALAVNVGVNLLLIPRLGILGAALAWAAAILVNNLLPLLQIWIAFGQHPFGRGALRAMALCALSFALLPFLVHLTTDAVSSMAVALALGLALYLAGCWYWRRDLELKALRAIRRPRRGSTSSTATADEDVDEVSPLIAERQS